MKRCVYQIEFFAEAHRRGEIDFLLISSGKVRMCELRARSTNERKSEKKYTRPERLVRLVGLVRLC